MDKDAGAGSQVPQINFDIASFVSKVSQKGPEQAILELVTDLSIFAYKSVKARGRKI